MPNRNDSRRPHRPNHAIMRKRECEVTPQETRVAEEASV